MNANCFLSFFWIGIEKNNLAKVLASYHTPEAVLISSHKEYQIAKCTVVMLTSSSTQLVWGEEVLTAELRREVTGATVPPFFK